MKKMKNNMLLIILSFLCAHQTAQATQKVEPNSGLIFVGAAVGAICFRACFYASLYGLKKCLYGIKKCLDSCDKYEINELLERQQEKENDDERVVPSSKDQA